MRYKLVKLDINDPNDARFIKKGLVYKLEMASNEDLKVMRTINALVDQSRKNRAAIYSGALNDDDFDAALRSLKYNDQEIQRLAKSIGIEMDFINPFANGYDFIED